MSYDAWLADPGDADPDGEHAREEEILAQLETDEKVELCGLGEETLGDDMKHSIWGPVQNSQPVVDGITWVTTASHGGFVVSDERYAEMSAEHKACSFTGDKNFEEDCSWCAVVLTWPEHFKPYQVKDAERTYNAVYVRRSR